MRSKILYVGENAVTVYEDGTILNQRGHKLSQYLRTNGGYQYVEIVPTHNTKRKKFAVHRLVALAFLPNPLNLPEVNHKDGNTRNAHVSNLEWVSTSENQMHSRYTLNNKTGFDDVAVKCNELNMVYASTREAWRKTGISFSHISECANGKRKTAGGYTWSKVEGVLE